ncbi:UNVERIFIED_CONTAM: hypothetical protein Sangu_0256600 [Sesamum angustifolium]|uniref:Uncharacterized protein n=1 Tax=Sesamum angustifolium TaxID=2727405 RepID=A0AAW2QP92_9LAMI
MSCEVEFIQCLPRASISRKLLAVSQILGKQNPSIIYGFLLQASLFFPSLSSLHPLLLRPSLVPTAPPAPKPTVYDLLPKYGLPSGLLPDSVLDYTLSQDGEFEVTLQKPCYIDFDYLVYYDKKITGKLNLGSITDLKGIQVQRFYFLWFDVDEIRVDLPPSDSIYFTVGIINKKLDVDQFLTVRSCKDKALTLREVLQ